MELSQTSLAMLLICGIPVGAALNLAYALTDIEMLPCGFVKTILRNVKDFFFAVVAGVIVIFVVYFVNHGEFRYMVLAGVIGGFVASHVTLRKLLIRLREMLISPIARCWEITLGKRFAKARLKAIDKKTQARSEQLIWLASNGFEN